jgi:UDP-GlcNAc:undecaprenyl-phosphate/decaprenyl-phosphate GlcNAc-1-phosphate transferase
LPFAIDLVLIFISGFLVAVVASVLVTPLVVRTAIARGLLDVPRDDRRVHKRPVPRLGGVAVAIAMGVALAAVWLAGALDLPGVDPRPGFLQAVLLGGAIVFAAGLWDDIRGLSPLAKLSAQVMAALVAFGYGFRIDVLGLGQGELALGWVALPLTVLWVVGVTNAFNLIDGLDGLATGVAIVALGTTLAAALALGNGEVVLTCAALLGALLGFLRYNFNPARIFLGDSGSLFVGFMLAVLSVYGSLKSATAVLVIVPLFALALPLFDTGLAIARRWLRGVPLSGADARHIHHRLLALGLTHRRAAVTLYLVASAIAALGLLLAFAPPTTVLAIAMAGGLASILLLLYGLRRLEYHEFVEAGAVLGSGVLRVRRVIQDQIYAREMAQTVAAAGSFEQLDHVFETFAPSFRFIGMEVCRESSGCRQRIADASAGMERAWKLDYPVTSRLSADDDPYVLRIWCGPEARSRPYGAERVARILAPALEEWLVRAGLARARQHLDGARRGSSPAPSLEPGFEGNAGWGTGRGVDVSPGLRAAENVGR